MNAKGGVQQVLRGVQQIKNKKGQGRTWAWVWAGLTHESWVWAGLTHESWVGSGGVYKG